VYPSSVQTHKASGVCFGRQGKKARSPLEGEISVCTETKQITGMQNFLKFDHLHVRQKLVHVELQELKYGSIIRG